MANLSFSVDGPTLNLSSSLSISDSDAPRILSYLLSSQYGSVTENIQTEVPDPSWSPSEDETEEDRPTMLTQQWVTRQATAEEAANNYAKNVLSSLLSATVEWEKAIAIQQAAESVTPIDIV
jgi:hypothetical protein